MMVADPEVYRREVAQLNHYDVLCGRSKEAFNNIGNRRFRITVSLFLKPYIASPTRLDKTIVIRDLTALMKSTGGRFYIRGYGGRLVELTERQIHEKCGHALRDMASHAGKSPGGVTKSLLPSRVNGGRVSSPQHERGQSDVAPSKSITTTFMRERLESDLFSTKERDTSPDGESIVVHAYNEETLSTKVSPTNAGSRVGKVSRKRTPSFAEEQFEKWLKEESVNDNVKDIF